MKKRIKITLRTKIYLTIVGLLALTGVFYAANPSQCHCPKSVAAPMRRWPSKPFPPASAHRLAADPDSSVREPILRRTNHMVDCNGNGSLFGTLPARPAPLMEKYMAIAPAESTAAGFTPGDLFVTLSRDDLYGQATVAVPSRCLRLGPE